MSVNFNAETKQNESKQNESKQNEKLANQITPLRGPQRGTYHTRTPTKPKAKTVLRYVCP